MTIDPQHASFFQMDVSAEPKAAESENESADDSRIIVVLLRKLLRAQEQQNELLEDLTTQMSAAQRQRAIELGQWREANPHLANGCKLAAESLSRVQTQFLENLTEEILENEDGLYDGEFLLNEFVDRYGPRLAHLNGVLQVLSQLSAARAES